MIHIEFTAQEKEALNYERYHHPHPHVQRKMEALWLKSQGLSHEDICRLTGISPNTLRSYLRDYQTGGIDKLKEVNFYQPQSALEEHRDTLEDYFRKHPPATIKEAAAKIKELTGIERKESQVRAFLNKLGMKCRKVGMLPAKADPDKQAAFKQDKLEPRLEEAKTGQRAVFFVDAAHFVLAPFLGLLWCFERVFIKAPAGRQRFNVLGALNAITHELITVTNDSYINAESVCELLLKLAELNLGVPITLILDNARYQKCALVLDLAKSLNIELLFLPAYSPNLNLIERLWKFVKKQCLYSIYYPDFASFKQAIIECLSQTDAKYKQDLDSLLTLNFQTFKKAQIMPA
jgi:transposase